MSNTVPLYGFGGGGGTALNFSVVGNPQPANPKENTIWVDTDVPITSWIFSAPQPEAAAEGMVWISTGTTSPVEFNALKKNGIQVCPTSAKQYVDGAWVEKTAKIYQGGAWQRWSAWLYKVGVGDYTELTGGWGYATANSTDASLTIDVSEFRPRVHNNTGKSAKIFPYTKNMIDFTGYSRLGIKVESLVRAKTFKFGVDSSTAAGDSFVASKVVTEVGTHYCDIDGISGVSRVRMLLESPTSDSAYLTISEIWLE